MSTGWQIAVISLWVIVIVIALVVLSAVRQVGVLALQARPAMPGLGPLLNDPAPAFDGDDVTGRGRWSTKRQQQRPALVAFMSPQCPGCAQLAPHLNDFAREHPEVDVAVVLPVSASEDGRRFLHEHSLEVPVLLESETQAFSLYSVQLTPHLVAISPNGMISGSGAAHSLDQLQRITNSIVGAASTLSATTRSTVKS